MCARLRPPGCGRGFVDGLRLGTFYGLRYSLREDCLPRGDNHDRKAATKIGAPGGIDPIAETKFWRCCVTLG